MRVKNFKPRYSNIQLMILDMKNNSCDILGYFDFEEVKKNYPENNIETVTNYDKEQTTCLLLSKDITEEEIQTEYFFPINSFNFDEI